METGLKYTSTLVVQKEHTAAALGSGDLPVLATPALIALMENAAMQAAAGALAEGQTTVGTYVEVEHLRATPLYKTVAATAVLTSVDGRELTFAVGARDERGLIGEGTHRRFVVDAEKFVNKLKD